MMMYHLSNIYSSKSLNTIGRLNKYKVDKLGQLINDDPNAVLKSRNEL